MRLTMINTLMMSTVMRMELLRSMDIEVNPKVSLCLMCGTSNHRTISSLREIIHTPAWAQENQQRPVIFPRTSMRLNNTLKMLIMV